MNAEESGREESEEKRLKRPRQEKKGRKKRLESSLSQQNLEERSVSQGREASPSGSHGPCHEEDRKRKRDALWDDVPMPFRAVLQSEERRKAKSGDKKGK